MWRSPPRNILDIVPYGVPWITLDTLGWLLKGKASSRPLAKRILEWTQSLKHDTGIACGSTYCTMWYLYILYIMTVRFVGPRILATAWQVPAVDLEVSWGCSGCSYWEMCCHGRIWLVRWCLRVCFRLSLSLGQFWKKRRRKAERSHKRKSAKVHLETLTWLACPFRSTSLGLNNNQKPACRFIFETSRACVLFAPQKRKKIISDTTSCWWYKRVRRNIVRTTV